MPETPDSWLERARQSVAATVLAPELRQIGRVDSIGDGVAMISGLPNARLDELLHFDGGQAGFVQTLDGETLGCVLLDDADGVKAGAMVTGTSAVVRTPVGPGLLGRVVDPLGRPLESGAAIAAESFEPIERAARASIDRDLVVQPLL